MGIVISKIVWPGYEEISFVSPPIEFEIYFELLSPIPIP